MTDDQLWDNLIGLWVGTDTPSAGIRDPVLQEQCFEQLQDMGENRVWLSRKFREEFLSEDKLANGYGIEDLVSFVDWLSSEGYSI